MCDWTKADISRISEVDFPTRCARCNYDLTGLGNAGRCPQCAAAFDRRKLLWETYGPEAFADPPIKESDARSAPSAYALLAGVVCTLFLPGVLLGWKALFGRFDFGFALIVWAVIVATIVWLVLVRRRWTDANQPIDDKRDLENPA